ncbi:hypothetical protein [Alkalibacillus haloalkaliphilus]|uniref:hypothetical protein n=1 Tax=Alkalibacillus haloalkaliphilus TaxID=94136 RepID=UPI0002F765BB|nr:hypothetical protein [Alkalibacillus haloalkaliphilus]
MGKKVSVLVSMILFGILFIGGPLQAKSVDEDDFEASNSRTVSVTEVFDASQYDEPPYNSIPYNSGGYSGTLELERSWTNGDYLYARYSGTVYCTGTCPIASSSEKE